MPDKNEILLDLAGAERALTDVVERLINEKASAEERRRDVLLQARSLGISATAVAAALNSAYSADEVFPRYRPQDAGRMMRKAERDANPEPGVLGRRLGGRIARGQRSIVKAM